jgi:KAP family P-loop domain
MSSVQSRSSNCWPDDPNWLDGAVWTGSPTGGGCLFEAKLLDLDGQPLGSVIESSESFHIRFRVEVQPAESWHDASGTWRFDLGFVIIGKGANFRLSDEQRFAQQLLVTDWRGSETKCIESTIESPPGTLSREYHGGVYSVEASAEFVSANEETKPLNVHQVLGRYVIAGGDEIDTERSQTSTKLEFSASVRDARQELSALGEPVTAAQIAAALKPSHPGYGGGRFRHVVLQPDLGIRRPVDAWLEDVSALYDANSVTSSRHQVVDGELVLAGLAELDPDLRTMLEADGFLAELQHEIQVVPHRAPSPEATPKTSQAAPPDSAPHVQGAAKESATAAAVLPLRPAALELLGFTLAIAMARGAGAATNIDVVLASLARLDRTELDKLELEQAATSALNRALPEPSAERIDAALSAAGVSASTLAEHPPATPNDPRMALLLGEASALARRLGADTVWSHHLVGVALAGDPLPDVVLTALGVSQDRMRAVLRSAIAERWSSESPAIWDEVLLGTGDVELDVGTVPDQRSGRPEARATSDRWTIVDELGYNVYADALADFILNPETPTPLAISVKGEWGTGKTSLMRMLRKRIDPLSPDGEDPVPGAAAKGEIKRPTNGDVLNELHEPAEERNLLADRSGQDRPAPTRRPEQANKPRRSGLPSIWFNAWIYQSSRQLWAGLAVAIINGVASRMSFIERERFWLTLQIRRVDGAALRRRIYRELAERVLPKAAALLIVSLGSLVVWALHSALKLPTAVTVAAGSLFFAPLVAIPVAAWQARRKFLEESLTSAFSDLIREPDYTTEAGFLHLFHRDMKLILEAAGVTEEKPLVIFVDDLDRCTFGTVAEVVEGLNLFLAGQFPHCIFIIGMEPTLVAAQLAVAYRDLFATLSDDDSAATRMRYGWRFLEKMVQLPVALPTPRAARLDRYVGSLTSYSANGDNVDPQETDEPGEAEIGKQEQALVEELDRRGGGIADVAAAARALDASLGASDAGQEGAANRPVRASVIAAARRVVSSRANEDDPAVRQMYLNYAGQLSGNPREFKRFLNLFRFYANLQITRELSPFPAPSLEQLAKITMLVVRWPDLIREFTAQSGTASAVATLELLAGKHRTVAAWSSAAKKQKSLADRTCAALLRTEVHSFLRQGPPIADYADEFL